MSEIIRAISNQNCTPLSSVASLLHHFEIAQYRILVRELDMHALGRVMPENLSMLWRCGPLGPTQTLPVPHIMFSYDVIAALLVPQINEMAAIIWCPKPILC